MRDQVLIRKSKVGPFKLCAAFEPQHNLAVPCIVAVKAVLELDVLFAVQAQELVALNDTIRFLKDDDCRVSFKKKSYFSQSAACGVFPIVNVDCTYYFSSFEVYNGKASRGVCGCFKRFCKIIGC